MGCAATGSELRPKDHRYFMIRQQGLRGASAVAETKAELFAIDRDIAMQVLDTNVDIHVNTLVNTHVNARAWSIKYVDMCANMCVDMFVGMCVDMCVH